MIHNGSAEDDISVEVLCCREFAEVVTTEVEEKPAGKLEVRLRLEQVKCDDY
tara:strand:+ start:1360 stop:1515 length:156 start_codon:yes stop_codon:yes gene_type:complete